MPTTTVELATLALLVVAASALYSAGGQAGASAYLAAMALFGVPASAMRPTALLMNVAVAATATLRFARAGAVPRDLVLPLVAGSIPSVSALLGGAMTLPSRAYLATVGAFLAFAALRLWLPIREAERPRPATAVLVGVGAAIGALSGLSGIGGGVLLAPILLLTGWEGPRRTAGASSVFILLNSLAALAGLAATGSSIPCQAAPLAAVALTGAIAGSWVGSNQLGPAPLRRLQATILLLAGLKLLADAAP